MLNEKDDFGKVTEGIVWKVLRGKNIMINQNRTIDYAEDTTIMANKKATPLKVIERLEKTRELRLKINNSKTK